MMGLPEGDGYRVFDVSAPEFLSCMRARIDRTLKVPTLAERLEPNGGVVVASNVSPGAAYFHDPEHFGHVVHRAGSYGPGGGVLNGGDWPVVSHDIAGDEALAEWFCEDVLMRRRPALGVLWLANPDLSMHADVLGSKTHLDGIAGADRCFARVAETVARLEAEGEEVLLLVGSDHGQESVGEAIPVEALMIEAGLKSGPDSTDLVVAPQGGSGLVYLADPARVGDVAAWLRAQPFIGAVFAGEEMRAIGQAPEVGLEIAFAMRSSEAENELGVPGIMTVCTSDAKPGKPKGHGSHGGMGRYETHPFLMIGGGGFAPATVETGISRLIDIAPTILRHLDLPRGGMDGLALPTH